MRRYNLYHEQTPVSFVTKHRANFICIVIAYLNFPNISSLME